MRIGNRGGHQYIGFIARIAKHKSLVASSLLVIMGVIYALRNIGRLFADSVDHGTRVAVETAVGVVVADVIYHAAHDVFDVDIGFGGYFAGD